MLYAHRHCKETGTKQKLKYGVVCLSSILFFIINNTIIWILS